MARNVRLVTQGEVVRGTAPALGAPAPQSARPGSDWADRGARRGTPRTGHAPLVLAKSDTLKGVTDW